MKCFALWFENQNYFSQILSVVTRKKLDVIGSAKTKKLKQKLKQISYLTLFTQNSQTVLSFLKCLTFLKILFEISFQLRSVWFCYIKVVFRVQTNVWWWLYVWFHRLRLFLRKRVLFQVRSHSFIFYRDFIMFDETILVLQKFDWNKKIKFVIENTSIKSIIVKTIFCDSGSRLIESFGIVSNLGFGQSGSIRLD